MNLLFLLPFAKNCCKMICIIGIITKNENMIFITKMCHSLGQCLPATYFLHLSIQTHYERPATLWFKMPNLIRKFVLMLYGFYIIFLHNTSLSKHQQFQEKWKRLTKVMKAKSKARELFISYFHDFLVFLESLDVVY